jgi:adenylate cyclase
VRSLSTPNSRSLILGLADCCSYLYLYWEPTVDNLRMADSASRRAITLSPGLAEAQVSRAVALSTLRNYPQAEQAFRTASEIDPNLFEAPYFYGRAFLAQGKLRTPSRRCNWRANCAPRIIRRRPCWGSRTPV